MGVSQPGECRSSKQQLVRHFRAVRASCEKNTQWETAPAGALPSARPVADSRAEESLLLWLTNSNHARELGQVIIYF